MMVKLILAHGLQTCVGNLWKEDDFSDFTIVVEDTPFRCHRFMLSACSHFFQSLFQSQMKECPEAHAKLDGMTKGTFDVILNSIYKGIDGLSKDNVLDVWSATELLQIDYLTKECKKFVMCNLSVDNCVRFLNHATMYSAQNVVIYHCLNFIIRHFEQVRLSGHILELEFDNFYKVIASDFLASNSEDSVMDTILKWVDYTPCSEHHSRLMTGTSDDKTLNKILPAADISTESLSISGGTDKGSDDKKKKHYEKKKENEYREKENNQSATLNDEDTVNVKSNTVMLVDDKTMYNKNNNRNADSNEGDRKRHLFKLISACRYLLLKSQCLEHIMKNYRHLLSNTGEYDLVFDAKMYQLHVDRRHDSWPEAAVHRSSSSNKHVMVFISNNKVMTYSLNTGSVQEFARLPQDCYIRYQFQSIVVFDNVLYIHTDYDRSLNMFTEQKEWECVLELQLYSQAMLLAHGSYIYNLYNKFLHCCPRVQSHKTKWTHCCTLKILGNCFIRFHQYIVVFGTNNNVVTAHCYNTETEQTHECTTSMNGTSENMVSFRHGDNVYILQRNGSLWKVFSTDTNPVHFELISKLWDFECSLKGCVLYTKKLFIFCDDQVNPSTLLTSLPGICENIQMIKINSRTQCLPMVLPESWLTSSS